MKDQWSWKNLEKKLLALTLFPAGKEMSPNSLNRYFLQYYFDYCRKEYEVKMNTIELHIHFDKFYTFSSGALHTDCDTCFIDISIDKRKSMEELRLAIMEVNHKRNEGIWILILIAAYICPSISGISCIIRNTSYDNVQQ